PDHTRGGAMTTVRATQRAEPWMHRREFLGRSAAGLGLLALPGGAVTGRPGSAEESVGGETIYNGITLPSPWPPRIAELPAEQPTPPYLLAPPAVIPIDRGRQLLVDDFLIQSSTLTRTFHTPTPHPGNPVLRPD